VLCSVKCLNRCSFDETKRLLSELLDIYGTRVEPDVDDKIGYVRALISRARIPQLHEAEDNWTAALLQNKIYHPFEEEGLICVLIDLFISSIQFQCGNSDGSQDMFPQAVEVIRRKRSEFLMPGLGTYLFDYVRLESESVAGFQLPEIAY